jgi:hypothetical protein
MQGSVGKGNNHQMLGFLINNSGVNFLLSVLRAAYACIWFQFIPIVFCHFFQSRLIASSKI